MIRSLFVVLVIVVLSGQISANEVADFDDNGVVDFQDFVSFASRFGSAQGDANYDVKYDIDGNGKVEFDDFTLFSEYFGNAIHGEKHVITADELEQLAKIYRENGKSKQAIQKYKEFLAITTDPVARARGFKEIGIIYTNINSLDLASSWFERALREHGDSENRSVKVQLVWCSLRLGLINDTPGNRVKAWNHLEKTRTFIE